MTHTRVIAFSLLTSLTAACALRSGSTLADFPTATGPQGAAIRLTVVGGEYRGELLETRADAFVILTRTRLEHNRGETREFKEVLVRRVPHARVVQVQADGVPAAGIPRWEPRSQTSRERFRLISRFPQGLTPELLQQLLKMHGQTEVAGGQP